MIEPITYVILNHGRFGEELIKSAELIAGKTEHIHAVSLLSGMSIEEYYEEVRDYLTGVQGEKSLCWRICMEELPPTWA